MHSLHTIAGGSQFGDVIKDYAQSVSAKCTTAAVTVDKSNYWTPQLYYFDPVAETFSMIPVSFMNSKYFIIFLPSFFRETHRYRQLIVIPSSKYD